MILAALLYEEDILMIVLSNTAAQTLQPGESIIFDQRIVKRGCTECHRKGTSTVVMNRRSVYRTKFHGNIGGTTAGQVQLSLSLNNDAVLPETVMIQTVAGADEPANVSTETLIENSCSAYDSVKVQNTGTTPVVISPNCCFIVELN